MIRNALVLFIHILELCMIHTNMYIYYYIHVFYNPLNVHFLFQDVKKFYLTYFLITGICTCTFPIENGRFHEKTPIYWYESYKVLVYE